MLLIYVDLGKDKKEGQSFTWTHVGSVQLQNCGSCMVASRSDCLEPQRSGTEACKVMQVWRPMGIRLSCHPLQDLCVWSGW